jgi:putative Mg2+ transporter-C (MgtC) family protein
MSEMTFFLEPSVWLRLFLSVFLSGIIGWERELHGRPAGIRTHMMVCLGATMLILSSEYFHVHSNGSQFDSDRMAAGIITGIGFLGAGAIMREGNLVRGLTTAGCIWFVAGLGIVVGEKFYALAVWITLIALVMLVFLRYVESQLSVLHFQDMVVRVLLKDYESMKAKCMELFGRNGIKIEARKFLVDNNKNEVEVRFTMRLQRGKLQEEIIFDVSRLPGVQEVRF